MLLLMHAHTDTPHRYVHHARASTTYLYHVLIHCACPGHPPCCALVSILSSTRPRVVFKHAQPLCPAPRPSTTHHQVCVPMSTALSMITIHTSCELFSPCMQESIESDLCCVPQPAWTTRQPALMHHTSQCMYCMFAFDECVLSVNLASFTSHQCNTQ